MVVKQLVAVVAAVIVGTADRPFGRFGPQEEQKGSPESMTGSRNKSKTGLNFRKTEKIYLKRSWFNV